MKFVNLNIKDRKKLPKWNEVLNHKYFKIQLFIALSLATIALYLTQLWISFNETRISEPFNDPILALFNPIELSIPISILTNLGWMIGIISSIFLPFYLIRALFSIATIAVFRIITMYLVPLEPPINIIPLRDFFLESTFYADQIFLKDLFFSGHTAVLILFCMLTPYKRVRIFLAISALLVGVMLILQHVHYTIDVLMAPVFTVIIFTISNNITEKYCGNLLVSEKSNKT